MVWQLKRKRPTRRRSYASSLAMVGAALLAQSDFTVLAATNSIRTPEVTDDSSSTQQSLEDKNNNRRLRADLLAIRVENQSNKITLLVKYKGNTGHRRSTETYNNRTLVDELQMDVWQAHTLSIETISINRYIDAVEIDTDVEDIELMKREIMEDGNVELVEEVCFCRFFCCCNNCRRGILLQTNPIARSEMGAVFINWTIFVVLVEIITCGSLISHLSFSNLNRTIPCIKCQLK